MCFRELTYNAGRKKNAAAAPSPKLLPLNKGPTRRISEPAHMSAEYLATVGATLESTIREAVKVAVLERAPNAAQRVAECINPAAADELAELRREVARLRQENEALRGVAAGGGDGGACGRQPHAGSQSERCGEAGTLRRDATPRA